MRGVVVRSHEEFCFTFVLVDGGPGKLRRALSVMEE
jgi:hypothetical protein